MSTRQTLTTELANRLGDTGYAVWPAAELKGYIDYAIKGLYPTFFRHNVETTTAADGPLQAKPSGARNLHALGLKRAGSTRVRPLRGWQEGDQNAFVAKTGITGDLLVWGWTSGWDAPVTDNEVLSIPAEAEAVVVIRAQIVALEKLLSNRLRLDKYYSLNVRQAVSETDVQDAIDGLRQHLSDLLVNTLPLPEKKN